ncbi:MAG: dihydroorotase [Rikenellaceae bacterium]|nr:dihydroorotase [Rikenellaceae bacterium]
MGKILIENARLINESEDILGYILIENEIISDIQEGKYIGERPEKIIDATDKIVIPGIIDDQVHFREPGLTYKADIHSESIAAVAGGVTSFMEMPNTVPQTTKIDLLNQKFDIAAEKSVANYSFYLGATNDNLEEIKKIDPKRVCGLKLFMGSSTGNMLVDDDNVLSAIFSESPVLIATHCEEESIIKKNLEYYKNLYGDRIEPYMHPLIRSEEACYVCSARAVKFAEKYGSNLHVLHISTEREVGLFERKPLKDKKITSEVCVHHLWFNDKDYKRLGNFIKWNPAIKSESDRSALIKGIESDNIDIIATDHAPHSLEEKKQSYLSAPSGGPLVQHSINVMMELYKRGEVSLHKIVEKMCRAPAMRYSVKKRGFLKKGYFADIAIIDLSNRWEVETENILYKCKWSPFDGMNFTTAVTHTIINGKIVFENGEINTSNKGMELQFDR